MNSTKKILVTGGAGYIGSVLIGKLLGKAFQVRTIDNLMFSDAALKQYMNNPNFEFIKGDIRDKDDVGKAVADVDTVVHLAAIVGDPACKKFPELATSTNKDGAEHLCLQAIDAGVSRFIFASTCSNYGKMLDPEGFVDETAELNPISLYAELKVGFEQYLVSKSNDSFCPVVLRFATAYGLSPRPRFDLTVNEFTKELFYKRKLEIFGEQFWRPYCHTGDLAQACLLMTEADRSLISAQAFNVGNSNENYRKKMLIDEILKQLPGSESSVSFVTKDEDPRDYRVNFDKIKKLGYHTSMDVPRGINEIIQALSSGTIKNPDDRMLVNI